MENTTRLQLERYISRALIRHLSARGWHVFRTFDGVEFEYPRTETKALELIHNLDEVSVRFVPDAVHLMSRGSLTERTARRIEGENQEHGVLLVLGNGEDIVSDWNFYDGDRDGFHAAMEAFDVEVVIAKALA